MFDFISLIFKLLLSVIDLIQIITIIGPTINAIRSRENLVQAYPINDMCVNPVYGSVVSVGGNGKYYIWDITEKSKINERENTTDKTPLTATDINKSGILLAYASGYDWSKGAQFAHLYTRPKIFIHYLQKEHRKSKNY